MHRTLFATRLHEHKPDEIEEALERAEVVFFPRSPVELFRWLAAAYPTCRRTTCWPNPPLERANDGERAFHSEPRAAHGVPVGRAARSTVAELLELYFERWPTVRGFVLDDQGEVRKHMKVLVDGRNLRDRKALSDASARRVRSMSFQALSGG